MEMGSNYHLPNTINQGGIMVQITSADEAVAEIRKVRQARLFHDKPVPEDVQNELLEVARWSGSSRNTQPWHFVVVTDKTMLHDLSQLRPPINWVADAPLAIAVVLDGEGAPESESYDEGRLTERVLIAARLLGLGGGTAWYGESDKEAKAKDLLGIPAGKTARSMIVLGYPTTTKDHRPNKNTPGRKPMSEIVSYGRYENG
jgi:nitroreductase